MVLKVYLLKILGFFILFKLTFAHNAGAGLNQIAARLHMIEIWELK